MYVDYPREVLPIFAQGDVLHKCVCAEIPGHFCGQCYTNFFRRQNKLERLPMPLYSIVGEPWRFREMSNHFQKALRYSA
jgi:hypothetical protein